MLKQVKLIGQLGDLNWSKIFGVAINTIGSFIMANQELKRERRKVT